MLEAQVVKEVIQENTFSRSGLLMNKAEDFDLMKRRNYREGCRDASNKYSESSKLMIVKIVKVKIILRLLVDQLLYQMNQMGTT